MPLEYGKPQCRIHRAGHTAGRASRQAQPDRHPADGGIGKRRQRRAETDQVTRIKVVD